MSFGMLVVNLYGTIASESDEQKACRCDGMCRTGALLCILLCYRTEPVDKFGCNFRASYMA